jgi:transcription antitermination protein NusB
MSFRKQTRSIARELALLSLGQFSSSAEAITKQDLDNLVIAAVQTLITEVQDILEASAAEVKRGNDQLSQSETKAVNVDSAKAMVKEALQLAQTAINRLGLAVELPEFIQLATKAEARKYAVRLLETIQQHHSEIETSIAEVLVAWQLNRLPTIDRNILKIAVAEIKYLEIPKRVAIDEAVELAKRYTDEEGYRFINGVLRKVTDKMEATTV